jgi:uncharacterized caspase-like protein
MRYQPTQLQSPGSAAARRRTSGTLRIVASALLAAVVILASANAGFAQDKRVALIIGNSKYLVADTLKNPVSDAAAMQVALHGLGFHLTVGQDLTLDQFKEKVREFTRAMVGADIALLFYAGHGVQYKDQNYLLPIDIDLKGEADVSSKAMRLNAILEDMGRYAKASVIFLDACRDSPQFRSVSRGPATGSPSIWEFARGLATITAIPADRFVGFAAAPGTSAEDGKGKNSPFTTALLKHITKPDEIGAMFTAVRREVQQTTRKRQQPEALYALSRPLFLKPLDNAGGPPAADNDPPADDPAPSIALSADAEFWWVIKDSNDLKNFEDYLQLFPKGKFTMLAKRKVDTLKTAAVTRVPETKPRQNPADLATSDGEFVLSTGIARITKTHPKEEAVRSARALARAKAIASKLPPSSFGLLPNFADSSAEAAELLAYMSRGLTYEEAWTPPEASNNLVKVDLRAKVRLLEGERRLNGSIEPTADVIAGQPYRLKLIAKKDATIGVFAWQGDGTVVRLYPENAQRQVLLKGGEAVSFPRADDFYPAIASSNMPGERRNHEALIVVTGAGKIAFDRLVPTAIAEKAQHSKAPQATPNLLEGGEFLAKLVALPEADLEVLVLPYEVRAER